MPFHPLERAALVEALEASGPRGATLCEGWDSRHLAAHVVLRESDPLTAAGILIKPLAARTERVTLTTGDRAVDPTAYRALVERVRSGPPPWHPLHWAGDVAQLVELFVHTAALWTGLLRMVRLLYARSPNQLVLLDEDGRRHVVPRAGTDEVTVSGPVGELLLHAYGRGSVARVRLDGSPAAVAAMRRDRAS